MRSTLDICRLAGLLEGEGTFNTQRYIKSGKPYKYPRIQLSTTDQDVAQWAAGILGTNVKGPYGPYSQKGRKPVWVCTVIGNVAAGWMMTLYMLLGARRKQQIASVLKWWKAQGVEKEL